MKKQFALIGTSLLTVAFFAANAGTLFTSPIIFVQPQKLDFGIVATRKFATNTLMIENVGGGVLTGKASVPAPFKIISGGTYELRRSEVQMIRIVYSPDNKGTNIETVKFTGADTPTTATVIGKLDPRPPRFQHSQR